MFTLRIKYILTTLVIWILKPFVFIRNAWVKFNEYWFMMVYFPELFSYKLTNWITNLINK